MTTVNESLRRRDVIIAGSAVVPYDFAILNSTDIKVIQDGVLLTPDQYVVTGVGNDNGGTIILATNPSDGTHIVLLGNEAIKQTSSYSVEAFPPERIQNDFNKQTIVSQQLAEQISRSLKFGEPSLNANVELPDPSAIDLFLRITNLNPLQVGWGTLAALAGAVGIPLAFANGGTGASYASADALALGLKLARWGSLSLIPSAGVLTLPNPLIGNRVDVGVGDISSITTTGVGIGTLLVLDYTVGSNIVTDGASLQLQGRTSFTSIAGDRSLFMFNGTTWFEVERWSALQLTNATKFRRGDGTWQTLPAQTLKSGISKGLSISNNVTDPTNDIDIAAGDAVSDIDDPQLRTSMLLSATLVKQLDAEWAAGSAGGGRVAGQALADGTWFVFLFKRSGGAIDACFSNTLSFVIPDGGSHKIRIGSVLREGGAIVPQIQRGRRFIRKSPVKSFDANVLTSQQLITLNVPSGIQVTAILNIFDAGTSGHVYYHHPDAVDLAPSITDAPGASVGTSSGQNSYQIEVDTNTNRQIAARSTATKNQKISIVGWIDTDLLASF